jgi:hypothetical protein
MNSTNYFSRLLNLRDYGKPQIYSYQSDEQVIWDSQRATEAWGKSHLIED